MIGGTTSLTMLDIWSQGMCQNSYYYQQNDWWEKTVFFCLPNHVFQLAHFIGEIALTRYSSPLCQTQLSHVLSDLVHSATYI